MRRFAGCFRFVWNKALALEKENYEAHGSRIGCHGQRNQQESQKNQGDVPGQGQTQDTVFLG